MSNRKFLAAVVAGIAAAAMPAALDGVVVAAQLAPAAAVALQDAALERFAWLEGEWSRPTRRGTAVESWRRVEGFGFVGGMVVVPADGGAEFATEALLLAEMGGEVFYFAYPRENPRPVAFQLVSQEGDTAVFENPDHDFPQRIVYRRDGPDAMVVTISDIPDDGEPNEIEFAFERR